MVRPFPLRAALRTAIVLGAVIAAALLIPLGASAQSSQTPPASASGSPGTVASKLRGLEREALRLTLVARLPEADRGDATKLLDRADALRQRTLELRTQELQAYVDALKAGTAPADARSQAQQAVATTRDSLQKDLATFRSDVQAFVQKVPQAAGLMRSLAPEMRAAGSFGLGMSLPGTGQRFGRGGRLGRGPGFGSTPGAGRLPGRGQQNWGRGAAPRGWGRGTPGFGWRQGAGSGSRPWWGPGQTTPSQPSQPSQPQNSTPPSRGGA